MKALKNLQLALVVLALTMVSITAKAERPRECFVKIFYLKYGGSASNSGLHPDSAKPFADGDLWAIPAGVRIDNVDFIIDTAITGTTVLEIGDDDDADGFVTDQAANFATPGAYSLSAKVDGAYLRTQTAGATDAADIDVVPTSKYYSAAGKELKLNITTANTAGKARVVVEGCYIGTYAP